MTATYLLGLAVVVAAAACRWLPAAGWVYRAPQLGLAAWYVVLAVVLGAAAGAAVSFPVSWCAQVLGGGHGLLAQLAGWAVLAALAGSAVATVAPVVRAARQRRRDQLDGLALTGRWDARLDATVVDHPDPAAYLVPGRAGTIVVTTGAVHRLPPAQLAAVLAHERAHATGRHHLLVRGAGLLAAAWPSVAVFTQAATQIARLVEMRADDVAARGHRHLDLARALVTCAEATAHPAVPAEAVAATGGDALERVHRLLAPPAPISHTGQATVAAGLAGLAAAPLLLVALLASFPVLATCLLVGGGG